MLLYFLYFFLNSWGDIWCFEEKARLKPETSINPQEVAISKIRSLASISIFSAFLKTVRYIFLRGNAHHFIEYSAEMRYAQIAGGCKFRRLHNLSGMNRIIYQH